MAIKCKPMQTPTRNKKPILSKAFESREGLVAQLRGECGKMSASVQELREASSCRVPSAE